MLSIGNWDFDLQERLKLNHNRQVTTNYGPEYGISVRVRNFYIVDVELLSVCICFRYHF